MLVIVLVYISAGQALPSPEFDNILQENEEGHNMSQALTQWQNGLNKRFKVECPSGRAFNRVRSQYNRRRRDRQWQWSCGNALGTVGKCHWTGYANKLDRKPLTYMCPSKYLLAGVRTKRYNRRGDRRWNFRCCHFRGHSPYNCTLTGLANGWGGRMDFKAPNGAYLSGAFTGYNHKRYG